MHSSALIKLQGNFMSNAILLAPGPVQLHPEVQKILAQPMIHHRTPEFDAILSRVLKRLPNLFRTHQPVLMHTSTGSGGMESLLVNLLSPGDSVLALVSGKFGERWAEMAEVYGAHVHRLNIPWGEAVDPQQVEMHLRTHPQTKLVLTQATETSTATQHPIQKIGEIVAKTEALLLVDGITAVGAYPLPMDAFNIDGLVAGSQKAIMLPTGLSFVSLSAKAWRAVELARTPRFYFDLKKELQANKKGETLFSSSVPLIKALDYVLGRLEDIGYEKHYRQLRRRADFMRAFSEKLRLPLFSKSPSDSVTAFVLPTDIDGAAFRQHLEQKYQVTLMGGQDQLKGKIIRLGHMGYITDQDLIQTMTRLALALVDFKQNIDPQAIQQSAEVWLKSYMI